MKTARDDVAVADRLNFVDAELPDTVVKRTWHKQTPTSRKLKLRQNKILILSNIKTETELKVRQNLLQIICHFKRLIGELCLKQTGWIITIRGFYGGIMNCPVESWTHYLCMLTV